MIALNLTPVPGDLIVWVYAADPKMIVMKETLVWSRSVQKYIPLRDGSFSLLISCVNNQINWLTSAGNLLSVNLDDVDLGAFRLVRQRDVVEFHLK